MHQQDLFGNNITNTQLNVSVFFLGGRDNKQEELPKLNEIYELSIDAYYTALYAAMSELPIKKEIRSYLEKVGNCPDRKTAAVKAADRGDPDTLTVLKAAYKVQHEIHRLNGLLRFRAEPNCAYTARCSPDHFVLPALAGHFTLRFGETSWAIIDEKRSLCLYRLKGGKAQLVTADKTPQDFLCPAASSEGKPVPAREKQAETEGEDTLKEPNGESWEDLWRLYHRSVNNEARKNPKLQLQFMPERYHKYLTEMN